MRLVQVRGRKGNNIGRSVRWCTPSLWQILVPPDMHAGYLQVDTARPVHHLVEGGGPEDRLNSICIWREAKLDGTGSSSASLMRCKLFNSLWHEQPARTSHHTCD